MKFNIAVHRTESAEHTLFAADRDDAIAVIRSTLAPGWQISGDVTVLGEGDEPVEDHVYVGKCEACECNLWDEALLPEGNSYVETDDGKFCNACAKAIWEGE